MVCVKDDKTTVLVVSEKGYGKRSFLNDPEDGEPVYRITNRGGKGVKTINVTEKTGPLTSIKTVTDEDDLMIITRSGVTIRMHIDTLRVMGRAAQGVRLINLKGSSAIAAVARVPRSDDDEDLDPEALAQIDLNPLMDEDDNTNSPTDLSTDENEPLEEEE